MKAAADDRPEINYPEPKADLTGRNFQNCGDSTQVNSKTCSTTYAPGGHA